MTLCLYYENKLKNECVYVPEETLTQADYEMLWRFRDRIQEVMTAAMEWIQGFQSVETH